MIPEERPLSWILSRNFIFDTNSWLSTNVFVHPIASSRKRIFINNYKATRNAIRKAMEGLPNADNGIENAESARHPLRNDP